MSLTLTLKDNGGNPVSGEGTSITLNNTAETNFTKFDLYGDTEQTTYSGKNMLRVSETTQTINGVQFTMNSDGTITANGTATGLITFNLIGSNTFTIPVGTYTLSGCPIGGSTDTWRIDINNGTEANQRDYGYGATFTLTAAQSVTNVRIRIANGAVCNNLIFKPMIERGSSVTTFEPYVGGVASPNPDYPQTVQTVTGEQTITISDGGSQSQSYTVNLGSIELCKIGDYQDYIYKNGDDWYVHKELSKWVIDSIDNEWVSDTASGFIRFYRNRNDIVSSSSRLASGLMSDKFTPNTGNGYAITYYANKFIMFYTWQGGPTTLAQFGTYVSSNPITVYYPLATATDTQITDENLIEQLEALYNTGHSYNGATIITSSSQYLPAIMDVTVGGSINEVTYIETELSNPLTITDIEGKSQNTTLNGNIYVDYVYNKKSFSVSIFNLKAADYATIRGFYDRQFTLNEFPLLSIPELNISEMPVFFEIGSREINSQCIVTDKLTLKFRETAQQ